MKKEERISRYGEAAYESLKTHIKDWRERNPDKVIADHRNQSNKGGKRYGLNLEYKTKGIQGEKNSTRTKHAKQFRPFKRIIAPNSQIHHEWIPATANYRGLALVEANQHRHGIIDVIIILQGKITLLTEEYRTRG